LTSCIEGIFKILEKSIKQMKSHSFSKIELIDKDDQIFVRKSGNISRNLERFNALYQLELPFPKLLDVHENHYDMEYIPHEDAKTFLKNYDVNELAVFITKVIDILSKDKIKKDYSNTYNQKLTNFTWTKYDLPFNAKELYEKLPKILPSSNYHGDLTLDNILYKKKDFFLIDPLTTEYDSFVFDLAKLRQDTTCKWFVRGEDFYFDYKLKILEQEFSKYEQFNNNYLLILMLMRVLPYATCIYDKKFIEFEIKKLWK
jgi:tRNA A-37 threonylcarbamoyl transferase component Bud32